VVGAGISGLACAYALKKSGADVLLLEGSAPPGGVIRSVEESGYLFETGPQSFGTTPALNALIQDLNLAGEFCPAPARAPRYILVNGKLRPVPLSPPAFFGSSLLNWSTKFAILREAFRKSRPPEDDESVADFVRRKFSPELLNLLVAPFVSGIYAGDPEKISLRAAFPTLHEAEKVAGSIIRGMKAVAKKNATARAKTTLASFRRGNQALIHALAERLRDAIRTGVGVAQISRGAAGFELLAEMPSGPAQFQTAQLVLATPTYVAASLLKPLAPVAAEALSRIEYAPVAVVSLGYRRADVAHSLNGFGFLVPRSAGLKILGTVWNSSLFPNRVPNDHVQLTSFLGGATDPDTASLSDSSLVDIAHRELTSVLGLKSRPATSHITAYKRAIPQYNLGHTARLSAIADDLAKIPGLHITGNYLRGPAIGACIEQAQEVAESIRKASQPGISSAHPDAFGVAP
jgi:oxygen-dependent protoporphyrinogen oxidase